MSLLTLFRVFNEIYEENFIGNNKWERKMLIEMVWKFEEKFDFYWHFMKLKSSEVDRFQSYTQLESRGVARKFFRWGGLP